MPPAYNDLSMLDREKSSMVSEEVLELATICQQEIDFSRSTTLPLKYDNVSIALNSSPSNNISNSSFPDENEGLLSYEAQNSLIVLYGLTILFAITGNILVVVVFTKGRRCRNDIRPFLINLAVADLIMALFCMPFTFTYVMTRTWLFSQPMCPVVLFMQHLSVSASVFTNMAIGIDRFLVVTFPLRARMSTKRARYTICLIWLCSAGLSSVQLVVGRAETHGDMTHCDEQWSFPDARRTFTLFVLLLTYIVPLVILSMTYSIVSALLWKRTAPGNVHEGRDLHQLRAKRKVIKMLMIVVIMFGLCWLPLQAFFLVLDFNPHLLANASRADLQLFTAIYYTVFWLAMSNSCANPIIYGFTNTSFRFDLALMCYVCLPCCFCLKRVAHRRMSVSTFESTCNKRVATLRRCPGTTLSRRGGCRNNSRVYIQLHKDVSRARSQPTVSEHPTVEMAGEQLHKCSNGRSSRHLRCNHHQQALHLRSFFETENESST